MEAVKKSTNIPVGTGTIFKLPNELLLLIFRHLNSCDDIISFALACKRFSSLCQSLKHLDLENSQLFSLGKSLPVTASFFKNHLNPSILISCNLNGCYWIPSSTLKSFLVRCTNLEKLHVAETELSIEDIVSVILPKCKKVTSLSFTLRSGDWFSISAHLSKRKKQFLCQLKSVEMMVAHSRQFAEVLNFLQSCKKLEEIVVSKISPQMYAIFRQQFELPHLKSLVFVAQPVGIFSNQVYQFINFSMGCKLTTLWCYLFELNNSNINLNNLTSVAWITSECRDQLLPINLLHPGLQLGHLESYWEPEPVLMRTVLDSPTKLKLINCYYDSNNFQNFCENHPLLEVLKLCIGRGWNIGDQTPTVWNEDSWKNFCKLRILSLKTVSIEQDNLRLPYIKSIVQSCPLIQELEIIGHDNDSTFLTVEDLSSIAQLKNLKRLTLANFNVKDGLFLEHILMSCTQLESLRLKMIGPPGKFPCVYESHLMVALPFAKKLRTFCLFQYILKMELLLDALESCTSITRLSLVCPSLYDSFVKIVSEEDFASRMLRLCDKLCQLVALFCYVRVPFEYSKAANSMIKQWYRRERPALRVDIQPMVISDQYHVIEMEDSYHSDEFPLMYKDLLTSFQSQVALFPIHCNSFLQRTF